MRVSFKQIKKVKVIRKFVKAKSVFFDWYEDTPEKLNKAFDIESQFIKVHKFVKDPQDVINTLAHLKNNFGNLKN